MISFNFTGANKLPFDISSNPAKYFAAMHSCASDDVAKYIGKHRNTNVRAMHPADVRRGAKAFAQEAKRLANQAYETHGAETKDAAAEQEKLSLAIDGFLGYAEALNDFAEMAALNEGYSGLQSGEQGGRPLVSSGSEKPARLLLPSDRLCNPAEGETRFNIGDTMAAMAGRSNLPSEVRNSLSEGVDSAGGYTVPERLLRPFIDQMRAKNTVIRAGARTIVTNTKTVRMAKLLSDPVVAWRDENANIPVSDATFGAVDLEAKSVAALVVLSRELLMDSVNVGEILQRALTQAFAQELDRVALFGSGTSPEPLGIANTPGVLTTERAANGSHLTDLSDVVDFTAPLLYQNVDYSDVRVIMHPRTAVELQKIHLLAENQDLGKGGPSFWQAQALDQNHPPLLTTKIPVDETQGTSSNSTSVISGDFTKLMIGMREQMRIQVLSESFAGMGQVGWVCHMRADIALEHAQAFHVYKGIVPPPAS